MRHVVLFTAALLVGLVALGGCRHITSWDAPDSPQGVYTVTGDGLVEIHWDEAPGDVTGYRIYRSLNPEGPYARIGYSGDTCFVDGDLTNGLVYYYGVTAYDRWGESELSYALVFDTPRPAGTGLRLEDTDAESGLDFSGYYDAMVVPWDNVRADLFLFWDGGGYAMASTDVLVGGAVYGTDLQHYGPVASLDAIDWAPADGWSTEKADTVSLIEGHAYLVWTWENHFAKFRVRAIGYDYVVLDWAYQTDAGNPELDLIATASGDGNTYAGRRARDARYANADSWAQRARGTRHGDGSRHQKEVLP